MNLFREVVAAMRQTPQEPSFFAPNAMPKPTPLAVTIDPRILLVCSCGYSCRVSSPLGAFMSGWRKILWEEQHAQCWLCDREQRVRQMEES